MLTRISARVHRTLKAVLQDSMLRGQRSRLERRRSRFIVEKLVVRAFLTMNGFVMNTAGALVEVDQQVADKIGDELAYLATD